MTKKKIYTVCIKCGIANNKKHQKGGVFGCWIDTCDMCGDKNVPCASAQHDFGIYNNEKERMIDKMQDVI